MSRLRIVVLAVAITAALALAILAVRTIREGPGIGEVGAILHGPVILVLMILAFLMVLIASAALFWHRKRVRIAALVMIAGTLSIPLVIYVQHKLTIYRVEAEVAADKTRAAEIVAGYTKHLHAARRDKATLIALRKDLEKALRANGMGWGSGGAPDFYWANDLIIWLFIDPTYDTGEEIGVLDFPSSPACHDILARYGDEITTPSQRALFRDRCPDTQMD